MKKLNKKDTETVDLEKRCSKCGSSNTMTSPTSGKRDNGCFTLCLECGNKSLIINSEKVSQEINRIKQLIMQKTNVSSEQLDREVRENINHFDDHTIYVIHPEQKPLIPREPSLINYRHFLVRLATTRYGIAEEEIKKKSS